MKVGYICSDPDVPVFGTEGCSIHLRDMVRALADAGHEVFVVPASVGEAGDTPLPAPLRMLGDESLAAKAWQALVDAGPVRENLLHRDLGLMGYNARLAAATAIEAEKPDVLYERYSLFGWGGIELARASGIPLILEVNAPLCLEQAGYDLFPLAGVAEEIEGHVLRAATLVVAVSDWLADWAVRRGAEPERVVTIPNGIDDRLFRAPASGTEVVAALDLASRRVVGYVGSFQSWHDITGLLAAFGVLVERDPAILLVLVGDGERRAAVEAAVAEAGFADHVRFTGHVPHDAIPSHLSVMDVSVVPYTATAESYFSPLKLFEAMAAGVPTVAARIGQIASVVVDGTTGLLYEPGDNASLADAIWALLRDRDRAARMGRAAREYALATHTWATAVRLVFEHLDKVTR